MHNLFNNQRLVGLLFLVLSGLYVWYIKDIPLDFWSETEPFNARTMPQLYGYAGIIVACLLILSPSPQFEWRELRSLRYLPAMGLLSLLTAYGWCIEFLGFLTATSLLLFFSFAILGERRIGLMLFVSVATSVVFYFGLDLLDIYLSPGELWS